MDSQKGFHHGDRDLGGLKRHHSAVAADDLVVAQRMGDRCIGGRCSEVLERCRGSSDADGRLHEFFVLFSLRLSHLSVFDSHFSISTFC